VCFTDRQHDTDFDGYWSEPDASEAAVSWKAEDGIWEYRNRKRAHECPAGPIPNSKFTATTCQLPGWNARTFVQLLGHGNTLWYVGDSVTRQMLLATASLLHESGLRVEEDAPGVLSKVELNDGRNGRHFCLRASGAVSFRICHEWYDEFHVDVHHPASSPLWQFFEQRTLETDWVVMNLGLHSHAISPQSMTRLFSARRRYCTARDWQCSKLVWRETSPQHFAHSPGGLHVSSRASGPADAGQAQNENAPMVFVGDKLCEPHRPEEYAKANHYNLELEKTLLEFPEVFRVRIYGPRQTWTDRLHVKHG